jgi:NADH:ubiquinone reductase (H+-translocating)
VHWYAKIMTQKHSNVVIIGGGFAATKCAKTLRKKLSRDSCHIVLFSRENHMVFHPLLADVVGASLHADSAAATLRQMLPGIECRTDVINRIDVEAGKIEYQRDEGQIDRIGYDHLVIACGADSNLAMIPGMGDHAFPFKTMRDAVLLRAHIIRQLEKAEACDSPERQKFYLAFVIIGGGFSGVELAGEVNDLIRESTRFYRNFTRDQVRVTLVHSGDQILPEVSPTLRDFALKKMKRLRIEVLLNTRAAAATREGVGLPDGTMIRAATVICTIGTTPAQIVEHFDVPKERGRIVTDADMRVSGLSNVWAVGDCAYTKNAFDEKPSPTTGQFAERQGRQAAANIARVLRGEPTHPFYFKPLGQLCSIGGRRAVAEMFGLRISGFSAWVLWRSVYLLKLPSWSRRTKVALDWFSDLIFPRDLGTLRVDQPQPLAGAYYRPGDFIYRQGDPANFFYAIEQGEVEVLRNINGPQDDRAFAFLGPGDFCGEAALTHDPCYQVSVRARTVVRVMAMSREAFSKLAGTMAPSRGVLAEFTRRRSQALWLHFPASKEALSKKPLASFLEPIPAQTLTPDSTLEQALATLTKNGLGFLFVLDNEQCLLGVLNATDIANALLLIASTPAESRRDASEVQVRELLSGDPIMVSEDDPSLLVASTMLEHGLSWIPVVVSTNDHHLKGSVRAERIGYWMLQELGKDTLIAAQTATLGEELQAQRRTLRSA